MVLLRWTVVVGMAIPDAHTTTDPLIVEVAGVMQTVEVTAAQQASLAATVSR